MIVVTGANGFIGSSFIWQLNKVGIFDIIAVDTIDLTVHNLLANRIYTSFVHTSQLLEYLQLAEVIDSIEWVIHLGACSSTTETNWDFLYSNNYQYSKAIFQWSAKYNKNLIYASSAATYGDGSLGFTESINTETLIPLNLYGKSKILMDSWGLQQEKAPTHWYGLRFFNVFGPNEYYKENMASMVFKGYSQIKKFKNLGLFKSYNSSYLDGEQVRDFIYIKDIVHWMYELMLIKPTNGIYNMGYGVGRTWLDLAKALFSSLNIEENIHWLDMPETIKHQYQYFTKADMTKWQTAGLSQPQWSLEDAIYDYVANYLEYNTSTL